MVTLTLILSPNPNPVVEQLECYYPSVRTENKGLLALFSVRQGRWVDLLLDRLGFSITLELLTGIHGKATDCIRCIQGVQ